MHEAAFVWRTRLASLPHTRGIYDTEVVHCSLAGCRLCIGAGRVRIATIGTGDRSYTATGLTNGVTYYFWIKARQSSDSVWVNSNAASAVPMAGSGGTTYHWPLTGNLGTHDPTLINENGTWWEFQTGAGIYGKVSRNGGLQWDPLPSVLPNGLSWWKTYVPNQAGTDVWAPDVKVD